MNGYIGLLDSLLRHCGSHFGKEPLLELRSGLERASADQQGIGVEGVDHGVEEQTQRVRLNAEHFAAERVAFFRQAAHLTCRLRGRQGSEWMVRLFAQKVRQEAALDGSERAQRFEIAGAVA